MDDLLNYVVPGLTIGSVYALVALGLVLTYKTSGIFNFAHGGIAAVAAYLFYEFRSSRAGPGPWPSSSRSSSSASSVVSSWNGSPPCWRRRPPSWWSSPRSGCLVLLQSLMTAIYGPANLWSPTCPPAAFTPRQVRVTVEDLP